MTINHVPKPPRKRFTSEGFMAELKSRHSSHDFMIGYKCWEMAITEGLHKLAVRDVKFLRESVEQGYDATDMLFELSQGAHLAYALGPHMLRYYVECFLEVAFESDDLDSDAFTAEIARNLKLYCPADYQISPARLRQLRQPNHDPFPEVEELREMMEVYQAKDMAVPGGKTNAV